MLSKDEIAEHDRTIRKGRQPSIIFRCIPFIFCLTPNANRLNRNTKTAFITSLEYRASAGGVYAILKSELGGRVLKLNKYLPASIRVGRLGGSKVYRPVDASEIYGLEFTDLLSFISKGLDSLYEAGLLNAETTTEVISTIDNLEIFVNEIIGYGGFNYEDDIKLMEFEYLSGKLLNMLGSKREVVWLVNQEVRRVREQFLTKFPEADVGWEVARL
ncbi:hypothetical protein NEOLI_001757 [Neolecta irregularis DAH-3]|uniref:Uncharacterized protein n=1 Tax=Neolecta irregularis (strain DAH-3) TaxID=1198029 RepID=A0A1U7LW79_NEOID|nr:hypothetical protein NEOLI_001757 [Neolecta irregularis DAH-3]|eukprot:OLL26879.1 hypothetical protein NEOLI_001757 [Neolecta irregularis DAH-3]